MDSQPGYNTRQRSLILEYLVANQGVHVTADELAEHLKKQGNSVGKSTVYRYIEKLAEQGVVKKFAAIDGKSCCYQYTGGEECSHHHHFKCSKCGQLFHLECHELDQLAEHLLKSHGFSLDLSQTVLCGTCAKCAAKK